MDTFRRFYREPYFRRGFWLFLIGSGPLFAVMIAAALGLTRDPNPNPVGLGILAFFTFWPSVILMITGAMRANRRAE